MLSHNNRPELVLELFLAESGRRARGIAVPVHRFRYDGFELSVQLQNSTLMSILCLDDFGCVRALGELYTGFQCVLASDTVFELVRGTRYEQLKQEWEAQSVAAIEAFCQRSEYQSKPPRA